MVYGGSPPLVKRTLWDACDGGEVPGALDGTDLSPTTKHRRVGSHSGPATCARCRLPIVGAVRTGKALLALPVYCFGFDLPTTLCTDCNTWAMRNWDTHTKVRVVCVYVLVDFVFVFLIPTIYVIYRLTTVFCTILQVRTLTHPSCVSLITICGFAQPCSLCAC